MAKINNLRCDHSQDCIFQFAAFFESLMPEKSTFYKTVRYTLNHLACMLIGRNDEVVT